MATFQVLGEPSRNGLEGMPALPTHTQYTGEGKLQERHLVASRPTRQAKHRFASPKAKGYTLARSHTNVMEHPVPPKIIECSNDKVTFTPPSTSAGENGICVWQVIQQLLPNGVFIISDHCCIIGEAKRS